MNTDNAYKKASKEIVIKNLLACQSVTDSCKNADISRETFYQWCKDTKFNDRVNAALDSRVKVVEDALFKNALNGNVVAQIFFLCNRSKNRWENVNKIEHSGEIKNTNIDLTKHSKEYLEKALKELKLDIEKEGIKQ